MQVRLVDSSLKDIREALGRLINKLKKQKKKPEIRPLRIIMRRGNIEMTKGEWLKDPSLLNGIKLKEDDIARVFDYKNLNMGLLGYGDPKDGLKGLMSWVKHNVNPKRLKEDARDLNIKIEGLKVDPKNKKGVLLELRVPEKGATQSKDLENVKLEQLGYIGLSKWTKEQLEELSKSDKKLDKVIVAVLSNKAKLKEKVEDVIE